MKQKTWREIYDKGRVYEECDFTLLGNENNNMQNGIFKLSKENVYSAIVYGVVAVLLYILSKGTVFGLDYKVMIDIGMLAIITSVVKNLATTDSGNFVGIVKTVNPIE